VRRGPATQPTMNKQQNPSKIIDRTIWLVILTLAGAAAIRRGANGLVRDIALLAVLGLVVTALSTTFGVRAPRLRRRRRRRGDHRLW